MSLLVPTVAPDKKGSRVRKFVVVVVVVVARQKSP
jgi:hypothetical protein